jgi:hypothetical protein
MFLHIVFSMTILQTTFFSMYTILKMAYVFTSSTPRTTTFTLVFSRDGPISDERLPSVLWVVGSGSLAMLCFPTRTRALSSALWSTG